MIIKLQNKNILFIEPPKNATTSVRQWFYKNSDSSISLNNLLSRHYSYSSIMSCVGVKFDSIFSITRHPLNRLVSEYMYFKMIALDPSDAVKGKKHTEKSKITYEKYPSFHEFVTTCIAENKSEFPIPYLKRTSQTNMLLSVDNKNIEPSIKLLRAENLQNDFNNYLKDVIGEEAEKFIEIPLPHHNTSKRRPNWESYYNKKTLAIASEFYKADIENFNYEI